jgi:hypothetical protein
MFIFAATVLSVFDIEKVVINGVVQEPKNEFSSGVLVYVSLTPVINPSPLNLNVCVTYSRPKPFQSQLKPRSAKAESLVRSLDLPEY